jgi:hypothetical protein
MTSHGIFLRLSSDYVVFLSFEQFRGPLTLNSSLSPRLFQSLRPGLTVRIRSNELHFDSLGIVVVTHQAAIWSAPARQAASPVSLAGRFERLEYIAQNVLAARGNALPRAFNLDLTSATSPATPIISATLENCLGLGAGLTPSGDDLVLGYLLAVNRWGDLLNPQLDLPEINRSLLQAACRKTNTLSANLIECAGLGQADERLLLALDGIMTGEPDPETCLAHLLSWGHTSGAYTLAGTIWAVAPALAPAILQKTIIG